jgi:predicted RNA binding protein YcfA (HicA-like mRNA interferase family)
VTGRLPSLRPEQVVRALRRAGWEIDRQRGSHISLKKVGVDHLVVVVMHRREMPRGLLADIIKDAGLTQDEFTALL